ncbi:Rv2640c family ArsR-like transcriptional regulator [Mycobacteroides chelonae]|jgi:ArsR family transcriptional regulator, arsenate/arsenite/antimonite-responsive transcriptional repressor|uniref:Rv2640c family ArsR-like transcriptional regulator n=1 Tax=Mycobacteroides chelonae TaxID=1774 RepID=UPI003AAF22CB
MPKALPVIDISAPICCAPIAMVPLGEDMAVHLALRLKALADPARLRLMSILMTSNGGELCTRDLAELVGLTDGTVSHHLSQLKKAGLVTALRRGPNVYYRANAQAIEALRGVLMTCC